MQIEFLNCDPGEVNLSDLELNNVNISQSVEEPSDKLLTLTTSQDKESTSSHGDTEFSLEESESFNNMDFSQPVTPVADVAIAGVNTPVATTAVITPATATAVTPFATDTAVTPVATSVLKKKSTKRLKSAVLTDDEHIEMLKNTKKVVSQKNKKLQAQLKKEK